MIFGWDYLFMIYQSKNKTKTLRCRDFMNSLDEKEIIRVLLF